VTYRPIARGVGQRRSEGSVGRFLAHSDAASSQTPDNNKLELGVEVDVNKANASIKSVNTGLSSMEQAASKAAHGASVGIDGMTASMAKGAAAGNLIAESIKKALEWAKE
jgi:hypothetical protein